MEHDIIDELQEEAEPQEIAYATFWTRVKASFLDTLILAPVTYGLSYYILIYIKSFFLSVCIALALPVYKCFMEKQYGATFGKKIMNINVVSADLQRLTYKDVFSRNYYYSLSLIMSLLAYYFLYTMPEFQAAKTLSEVWALRSETPTLEKIVKYTFVGFFYIDNLLMLKSSRNQTLHDRVGNTVVLQMNKI